MTAMQWIFLKVGLKIHLHWKILLCQTYIYKKEN